MNVSEQSLGSIKRNTLVSRIRDLGTTLWGSHQSVLDTGEDKVVCRLAAGGSARSTPPTGDARVPGSLRS